MGLTYEIDSAAFVQRLESMTAPAVADLVRELRGLSEDLGDTQAARRLALYRQWKDQRQQQADEGFRRGSGYKTEFVQGPPVAQWAKDQAAATIAGRSAESAPPMTRSEAAELRAEIDRVKAETARVDAARQAGMRPSVAGTSGLLDLPLDQYGQALLDRAYGPGGFAAATARWAAVTPTPAKANATPKEKPRMSSSTARERERQVNRDFAIGMNPRPKESPAASGSSDAPVTSHWGPVSYMGQAPPAGPVIPDDLGLDADMIARIRDILGDQFEAVVRGQFEFLPAAPAPSQSSGPMLRRRAILSMLAEGIPYDPLEVSARVGEGKLRGFASQKNLTSLASLDSAIHRFVNWAMSSLLGIEASLKIADKQLASGQTTVDAYAMRWGPELRRRSELMLQVALAKNSLKALEPAAAALTASAVADAGGVGPIATAIRETRMAAGQWPGHDSELQELEAKLKEAAEKMKRFRPVDPETPEGPLSQQARVDRDGLAELTEARRIAVERREVTRVEDLVTKAMTGDPIAFDSLAETVLANHQLFPPGLAYNLIAIPLTAALQAGPSGWAPAL